jgi:hypothetical protein
MLQDTAAKDFVNLHETEGRIAESGSSFLIEVGKEGNMLRVKQYPSGILTAKMQLKMKGKHYQHLSIQSVKGNEEFFVAEVERYYNLLVG